MTLQEYEDKINQDIGRIIQEVRVTNGIPRKVLADALGVTHQQIAKYESGQNRINVGRLCGIARVLNVPVAVLLCDLHDIVPSPCTENQVQGMAVARSFLKITDRKYRKAASALVHILAEFDDDR